MTTTNNKTVSTSDYSILKFIEKYSHSSIAVLSKLTNIPISNFTLPCSRLFGFGWIRTSAGQPIRYHLANKAINLIKQKDQPISKLIKENNKGFKYPNQDNIVNSIYQCLEALFKRVSPLKKPMRISAHKLAADLNIDIRLVYYLLPLVIKKDKEPKMFIEDFNVGTNSIDYYLKDNSSKQVKENILVNPKFTFEKLNPKRFTFEKLIIGDFDGDDKIVKDLINISTENKNNVADEYDKYNEDFSDNSDDSDSDCPDLTNDQCDQILMTLQEAVAECKRCILVNNLVDCQIEDIQGYSRMYFNKNIIELALHQIDNHI